MIEQFQAILTTLGGPGTIFGVIGSAVSFIVLRREHTREKSQAASLSMAAITVEALQDTREGFVAMEVALRAQNEILRGDRDKFHDLYIAKRDELSEAKLQILEQNRTLDRMQREIDALKSQVLTLQNGNVTRTVTDVHIVQEPKKE